jgi:hypothetical protein
LNAWHQDQVTKRPEGGEVLASSLLLRERGAPLRRPHLHGAGAPEFHNDFLADMIEKRGARDRARSPPRRGQGERGASVDDALLADRIARFFRTRDAA